MNPLLKKDGYKVGHINQYPDNTEMVYSNFTARCSRLAHINKVTFFGLQYFIKRYLIDDFNKNFFALPREEAVKSYADMINSYVADHGVDFKHVGELHDLGYLPLEIRALPEGTQVPLRVPMFTVHNTHTDFAWLTNVIETLASCTIWGACTSASTAAALRDMLDWYATETGAAEWFVDYQAHDFSMRGMFGLEAAQVSGAGHLLSFKGSDTIPAIAFLKKYYGAQDDIAATVNATEHSVMCMGGDKGEEATYRRLLENVYPIGIVSIVSDTWDFWKVVMETLPALKDVIMRRKGKLVIRPDSGDPVKIICGDPEAETLHEQLGLIDTLYSIFGGTINEKGFKVLDEHVGAIYGDSITFERAEIILRTLKKNGFASSNIVFGVGSYTYQYVTRDTFGFAMKATAGIVNGKEVAIYKDPKTDDGTKRSAKGFLMVGTDGDGLTYVDELSFEDSRGGLLETVFVDGELIREQTLMQIREVVKGE